MSDVQRTAGCAIGAAAIAFGALWAIFMIFDWTQPAPGLGAVQAAKAAAGIVAAGAVIVAAIAAGLVLEEYLEGDEDQPAEAES